MEQNGGPRNRMAMLCTLNFFEIKRQKHTLGKKKAYPANGAYQIAFVLAEE